MNMSKSNKLIGRDLGAQVLNGKEFDLRSAQLTELLRACRDLSDILNLEELYSTFGRIVREKFGISELGLFAYDPDKENFELVYSIGLGRLEYKFKRDKKNLWQTILEDIPFAVIDGSGNPVFSEFLEKKDLNILPSALWIPMVMRDEVIGLLTIGLKSDDQPYDDFDIYYLQQIAAQAAVSINTCRLYERRRATSGGEP